MTVTANRADVPGDLAVAAASAQVHDPSPPESPTAADKENTPPGKHVGDGNAARVEPGSPPLTTKERLSASPPAILESSIVAVVGSTSCSPDKGASACGPAAAAHVGAAAEVTAFDHLFVTLFCDNSVAATPPSWTWRVTCPGASASSHEEQVMKQLR